MKFDSINQLKVGMRVKSSNRNYNLIGTIVEIRETVFIVRFDDGREMLFGYAGSVSPINPDNKCIHCNRPAPHTDEMNFECMTCKMMAQL